MERQVSIAARKHARRDRHSVFNRAATPCCDVDKCGNACSVHRRSKSTKLCLVSEVAAVKKSMQAQIRSGTSTPVAVATRCSRHLRACFFIWGASV